MRTAPFLLATFLLVPAVAGATPIPEAPDPSGWVIGGHWELEGDVFDVPGNLVLLPGARLEVRDATVRFPATRDAHPQLHVMAGATLEARGTRFEPVTPGDPAVYWTFLAEGRVQLKDTVVRNVEAVRFEGPATAGSELVDCTIVDAAESGIHARRYASFTLRDSRILGTHHRLGSPLAGGIVLEGTDRVEIRNNLLADVTGDALIAYYVSASEGAMNLTSPVIADNVLVDTRGTLGLLLMGGNAHRVEGNAIVGGYVGVYATARTGATFTGNDLLARPVDDATFQPLAGVHVAGGYTSTQVRDGRPAFLANRIRGFQDAAQAIDGATPLLRNNSLPDAPRRGLVAHDPVDARGNWWGDAAGPRDANATDGSLPAANPGDGTRVEGPVDYRDWRTDDPWTHPIHLEATRRADGTVHVTLRVDDARARTVRLDVVASAAPVPPREVTLDDGGAYAFTFPAGADEAPVVTARAAGLPAAAAVA